MHRPHALRRGLEHRLKRARALLPDLVVIRDEQNAVHHRDAELRRYARASSEGAKRTLPTDTPAAQERLSRRLVGLQFALQSRGLRG